MSDDYDWTPHLQEGEEVLWQGRPDQRWFIPTWFDLWALFIFGVIFAVLYPVLALEWRDTGEPRAIFLIFAAPIILVSIRFWVEPHNRRRQRYALTNRRALKAINGAPRELQQFHLREGQHVWRSGWQYAMVAFSRKTPGLFAKAEPFLRMDGAPTSPIGAGVRGAQLTFLTPEEPDRIVKLAQQIIGRATV